MGSSDEDEAEMRRERLKRAFYAPPPRRKTSAKIISEAKAEVYADLSSSSSSASILSNGNNSKLLRALPTRRPYTPNETHRTLYNDKNTKRQPNVFSLRPPGNNEEDGFEHHEVIESLANQKKTRSSSKSFCTTDYPSAPPKQKLPSIVPLKRRATSEKHEPKRDKNLECAISITQPFKSANVKDMLTAASKEDRSAESFKTKMEDGVSGTAPPPCLTRRKSLKTKPEDAHSSDQKKKNDALSVQANPLFSGIGAIAVHKLEVSMPHAAENIDKQEFGSQYQSIMESAEQLSKRGLPSYKVAMILNNLDTALLSASNKAILTATHNQAVVGGKGVLLTKARVILLRALINHVDSEDYSVMLLVAKLLLMMRVTGNHLFVACKLVFKIAKNDKNDHLFKQSNIIELLVEGAGRACPLTESETCVYAAGALRFLALDPDLRSAAIHAGALHVANVHIKMLNSAKLEAPREVSEQATHALYQLTGALRNIASDRALCNQFVHSNILKELCLTLKYFITDIDVVTNVARILSVLSAEEPCCAWLCESDDAARALLRALCTVASRAPLAVRLAYTLGNMAAASQIARENIYNEPSAINCLLAILETYITMRENSANGDKKRPEDDPDQYLIGSDLAGSNGSYEDVLVKTVRVLANLCLEETAGKGLADKHSARLIRSLLLCCSMDMQAAGENTIPSDELLCASLATLNNLTYYLDPKAMSFDGNNPFAKYVLEMCEVCKRCLRYGGECGSEAIRVLGNLTRCPKACALLTKNDALLDLGPYLIEDDQSLSYAAAGVLVNACAYSVWAHGGMLAASALRASAKSHNVCAAALLVRALWNVVTALDAPALPGDVAKNACVAIKALIGDDTIFSPCEEQPTESDIGSLDPVDSTHSKLSRLTNERSYILNFRLDYGSEDVDDSGLEDLDYSYEDGTASYCGGSCKACMNLAAWEELAKVAVPLLDKLRPVKIDASVGTEAVATQESSC